MACSAVLGVGPSEYPLKGSGLLSLLCSVAQLEMRLEQQRGTPGAGRQATHLSLLSP